MSGFFSNFVGNKIWSLIFSKTPEKYRDDLERALKKGHEVVSSKNKKAIEPDKQPVKTPTQKQREKARRIYMRGNPVRR
jgi:hypothetical protein